jgi:S-adenosylmethionine:tRNA-ribosyltransferase-isomerase (queuine synthetase)
MVLCVVVLFPSRKEQSPKEEFQLGQAHQNYTIPTPNTKFPTNTKTSQSSIHSMVTDGESVEMVLDGARKEIKQTEKEQLDQLEETVETTTTSITNNLRIGMGRLFGNTLSSEEVEAVATQVQDKLTSEAKTTLRGKADQLTNSAIKSIETKASSEGKNGYGVTKIEKDV